jgi:GMP reductase
MKLDFNDVLIVPKESSPISSRSHIDIFEEYATTYRFYDSDAIVYNKCLPLITAPMDTVINRNNANKYFELNINICMPRGEHYHWQFNSFSISEMQRYIGQGHSDNNGWYLIDIANGHMSELEELVKRIKNIWPNCILMVGNIANPETYVRLSEAGADYIRVGIGNGGGCLTTQNTGVGYPMASLIKECYEKSLELKDPAYIVADGGMQSYSDIIKALACGANYVMLGSIFNKSLESAGDNYLWKKIKVSQKMAEKAYRWGIPVYKKFRGMSTKEVQKKWGAKKLKTSEGVVRYRKVEYTLKKWVENFEDYLRSAMSYTGSYRLKDFIGNVKMIQISDNAYKRFNK